MKILPIIIFFSPREHNNIFFNPQSLTVVAMTIKNFITAHGIGLYCNVANADSVTLSGSDASQRYERIHVRK